MLLNPNNLHSKNEELPKDVFWKWSLKPFHRQAAVFWADISNEQGLRRRAPLTSSAQTGIKLEDETTLAGILPALVIQYLCEPTRALSAKQ